MGFHIDETVILKRSKITFCKHAELTDCVNRQEKPENRGVHLSAYGLHTC